MTALPDEIRRFCSTHDLQLNTDLGQHFLIDADVLHAIIEAADIRPDEHIVEIGPGIGILTRELLKRTPHVTTIELDERMIPLLQKFVAMGPRNNPSPSAAADSAEVNEITNQRNNEFSIIHNNALHVPFPVTPYKIVANIPYHITSPLLRHAFLEGAHAPRSLTLLIQREVAEKICQAPAQTLSESASADESKGNKGNAGFLTIVVGLFGTPKIIRHVPPSCFLPPPKVDSSVLHIDCFAKPRANPEAIDRILRLVKVGFGQKRKMLRNTISQLPDGPARLERSHIDPTRRPQTLSMNEWIALAAPL